MDRSEAGDSASIADAAQALRATMPTKNAEAFAIGAVPAISTHRRVVAINHGIQVRVLSLLSWIPSDGFNVHATAVPLSGIEPDESESCCI
jgi:hypothetical protein